MYQFNLPLAKDMKWSQIETEKFPITSISTSAFFAIIYKRGEPLNSKMVAEKRVYTVGQEKCMNCHF